MIRIAKIIEQTKSEGPGNRLAIWVQGCSIKCKGCINPEFIPFNSGKNYSIEELMKIINKSINEFKIEGITLLGGEPLDQKQEVLKLIKEINKKGLNIILFTGYYYKDLVKRDDNVINEIFKRF